MNKVVNFQNERRLLNQKGGTYMRIYIVKKSKFAAFTALCGHDGQVCAEDGTKTSECNKE